MAKKYKNYLTLQEYDNIPEGYVSVGKLPDGTYIILQGTKDKPEYIRVSASDPRVPKMASETLPQQSINTRSGIDMYQGQNASSIDPGNISDYDALFGDSRKLLTVDKIYGYDEEGNPKYWTDTDYFHNQRDVNQAISNTLFALVTAGQLEIAELPSILQAIKTGAFHLIKNPKVLAKIVPIIGGGIAGGYYGGLTVDYGMRLFNGKTWSENISDITGWPKSMSEMTNPGTIIGGLGGGYAVNQGIEKGISMVNPMLERWDFAHLPLADSEEIANGIRTWSGQNTPNMDKGFYTRTAGVHNRTPGGMEVTGGPLAKPGTKNITTEMHVNPRIFTPDGRNLSFSPEPGASRGVWDLFKTLPNGTVLTSSSDARIVPLLWPEWSFPEKFNFIMRGKTPTYNSMGKQYSTDIAKLFKLLSDKGKGLVSPSLTTRVSELNSMGKSYNRVKDYLPLPQGSFGTIKLSDMTPEQIARWNTDLGSEFGYIDPVTKTMDHYTFITNFQ